MSQKIKSTPPVTPKQTRIYSFFPSTPTEPPSVGKKRTLSSDSPPSTSDRDLSTSKHLKFSQSSELSFGSQTAPDTELSSTHVSQECEMAGVGTEGMTSEQIRSMQARKEEALKKKRVFLFTSGLGPSWRSALKEELSMPYIHELIDFVESERKRFTVYPPPQDVFTWSTYCHIEDTQVVILGQDPYHGPSQAHGLCFSVARGVAVPPSLVNIYKELKMDVPGFEPPKHGHLSTWAEQGVLLLNACLTVRAKEANSHRQRGWEKFTDSVVHWIDKNLTGVVFLLWGKPAQEKGSAINPKKHLVLRCAHPSPFSADKGFFGCRHFSKTNSYLKEHGKRPIDWSRVTIS